MEDKTATVSVSKQAALSETGNAAGNTGTSATMAVGDTFDGEISSGSDSDWVRIELTGGQDYVFSAWGINGNNGLSDTIVTLYDADGNALGSQDDLNPGHGLLFSGLQITAPSSGTYYIEVTGFGSETGDYTLQAATDVYTPQQIATYLTEVDWGFTFPLRLDAQAGGTLTYNTSALTAAGAQLAEWALESWSITTGITFTPSSSGSANIIFDDSQSGAFAGPSAINPNTGVASQSSVNISTAWLDTYGTTIDSFSFSTYVHEIGHALGLGHSGPYDGAAVFGSDNLYANDSLQMSIMSYFDPSENPNILGNDVEIISPMMADIVAMDLLYGGTQVYQGNTTWGANSNIGGWFGQFLGALFDGENHPDLYAGGAVGFTINDTGGIDTIDVSTINSNQRIDMRSERFSDIDGLVNNVAIAVGTVIENAIGGSGNDLIRGNEIDNRMEGNAGNDTINGAEGTDTAVLDVTRDSVTVAQDGTSGIQITSALGVDVYRNVEFFEFSDQTVSAQALLDGTDDGDTGDGGDTGGGDAGGGAGVLLTGTANSEALTGTEGDDTILAQAGNDTVNGGGGADEIAASNGNDLVNAGGGNDNVGGGLGNDTVNGENGNDTVGAGQGDDLVTGGAGDDALYGGTGEDNISGESGNDDIGAGFNNDTVSGGAGDDSLGGGTGRDVIGAGGGDDVVGGGEGDDTISGGAGSDFLAGGGRDDIINGGIGSDTINGGAGNDTITGGTGADLFIFNEFFAGETDIITDFQNGVDTLRMTGIDKAPGSGLQGFLDALDVTDVSAGVQLSYQGNRIILEGVDVSQIGVEDFIFV